MSEVILVVEDEVAISRVLKAYLEKSGYQVEQAFSGMEALMKCTSTTHPSLVLLDVMLPDYDGWYLLGKIRERHNCPVIMLTALGSIDHKLKGLDLGADDYITKPFIGEEVTARVRTVLRRSHSQVATKEIITYGSLMFNFNAHSVHLCGEELYFTPRDLSLLLFLAKHPNQTFTRNQLIEQVWSIDYEGSDRAVDLAVKRIRKTLERWPNAEGEIKTLRGLGYQFSVEEV
ncbi:MULTISPECIES: response regulator transcription factor [Paenibacillus]|uniref:response regulator transcription factor n=1 Tax=Paenibacillus TaxID=44249 RepID=UPI000362B6ED|nr:response regulator transcription factor [Paenibacillus massiliensis]